MKDELTAIDALAAAERQYLNECTGTRHNKERIHEINGFIRGMKWIVEESDRPSYAYKQE